MSLRSKLCLLTTTLVFSFLSVGAQKTRIQDNSTIGWYNTSFNYKLTPKWDIQANYQWRRTHLVTEWQQSFTGLGFSYNAAPRVQLRAGYNWLQTFPYGNYPLNAFGKQFTEHRIFESAALSDQIGRFSVTNRVMLEQRWLGTYSNPTLENEDDFSYVNRARYMVRLQTPLGKSSKLYAAAWNEIFVGFGENVGENIFDQNRTALLLGLKFSERFSLEGGYFNQTVQLGREVAGSNVFQYNNGIIVNASLSFGK